MVIRAQLQGFTGDPAMQGSLRPFSLAFGRSRRSGSFTLSRYYALITGIILLVFGNGFLPSTSFSMDRDNPGNSRYLNLFHEAEAMIDKGNHARAIYLLNQAIEVREKDIGSKDREIANMLTTLAGEYRLNGQMTEAISCGAKALKLFEDLYGADDAETIRNVVFLQGLYYLKGDFVRAAQLGERAAQYQEKHALAALVETLNLMSRCYGKTGELSKLAETYRRMLLLAKQQKYEGLDAGGITLDLATTLVQMEKYDDAETLVREELEKREARHGPKNATLLAPLEILAAIDERTKKFDEAEAVRRRILEITRIKSGHRDPAAATALDSLVNVLMKEENYRDAEAFLWDLVNTYLVNFGQRDDRTTEALIRLGVVLRNLARPWEAISVWEEALPACKTDDRSILGLTLADTYFNCGVDTRAADLYREIVDMEKHSPHANEDRIQRGLTGLATTLAIQDHHSEAMRVARECDLRFQHEFDRVLKSESFHKRLEFFNSHDPYSALVSCGARKPLAQALLRYEGAVLDSLMEDKRLSSNRSIFAAKALAKLFELKTQLEEKRLSLGLNFDDLKSFFSDLEEIERLQNQVEKLESQLGNKARRSNNSNTLGTALTSVQAAIPADSALITFVRFARYDNHRNLEQYYGAIGLYGRNRVFWIELGTTKELDKVIQPYSEAVSNPLPGADLALQAQILYHRILEPIIAQLPSSIARLILAPTGELNAISFAALPDSNMRFAAERYIITYVTTGRDLLRKPTTTTNRSVTIFGNARFSSAQSVQFRPVTAASGLLGTTSLANLGFSPLPGTELECITLEKICNNVDLHPKIFLGSAATKAALKKIQQPYILHLATHGYVLSWQDAVRKEQYVPVLAMSWWLSNVMEALASNEKRKTFFRGSRRDTILACRNAYILSANDLFCSAIALAGAQDTLDGWFGGKNVSPKDNGLVSAEDILALDLRGTWLVTVSACKSGLGVIRGNEGLIGLRRAFAESGARNVLLTLWSVNDRFTRNILLDFYKAALPSNSLSTSLRDVQVKWLVKLRDSMSPSIAISLAGPFVLSSQGTPE